MMKKSVLLFCLVSLSAFGQNSECLSGNCVNGFGKRIYPGGSTVEGFFYDNVVDGPMMYHHKETGNIIFGYNHQKSMSGLIVQKLPNGIINLSYYLNNILVGKEISFLGEQILYAQENLIGQFYEDLAQDYSENKTSKSCKGNCTDALGQTKIPLGTFTGIFEKKSPVFGKIALENGELYFGELKGGKFHFLGLKTNASFTEAYYGMWKNGKRNGLGYTIKDGKITEAGIYKNDVFTGEVSLVKSHLYPLSDFQQYDNMYRMLYQNRKNIIAQKSILHAGFVNMKNSKVDYIEMADRIVPYLLQAVENNADKLIDFLEPYAHVNQYINAVFKGLDKETSSYAERKLKQKGAFNTAYDLSQGLPGYTTCRACRGSGRNNYTEQRTYNLYSHTSSRTYYSTAHNSYVKETYNVYKPTTFTGSGTVRCINCQGHGLVKD